MKNIYIDKNGKKITREILENLIDFTREEYDEKNKGYLDFDIFLDNVVKATLSENGTLEDAIYIANDAFEKL